MRTSKLTLALLACVLVWGCESPKAEKEERENAKRLDDFYEMAWIQCVSVHGLDYCRVIQETGFQQCHNYRTAGGTERPDECMQRRFDDRLEQIRPQKDEAEEPVEEGKTPRAAPPVHKEPPPEAPEQPVTEKF